MAKKSDRKFRRMAKSVKVEPESEEHENDSEEENLPLESNVEVIVAAANVPDVLCTREPEKAQKRRRTGWLSLKPSKRTIPCCESDCTSMFAREQDMKKHHKMIHVKKTPDVIIENNTEFFPLPIPVKVEEERIKTEPPEMPPLHHITELETSSSSQVAYDSVTDNNSSTILNDSTSPSSNKRHAAIVARGSFIHGAFRCHLCPKAFDVKGILARHLRTVHGLIVPMNRRTYTPPKKKKVTESSFEQQQQLPMSTTTDAIEALQQQHQQPQLQAPTIKAIPKICIRTCCGTSFSTKASFQRHRRAEHPEKASVFFCNICYIRLESRKALLFHYKNDHVGERVTENNVCNICGRTFASGKVVYMHKRRQHKELFIK